MGNERLNILKLLIENQGKPYSIRQIGIRRKINYKSAYMNLKRLEKEGIATLTRYGNTIICSFNHHFNSSVFEVEHARLQDLLRNKDFSVIYNRLAKIDEQFILLLFGSYAMGRQAKSSDIDLLLISNNPMPIDAKLKSLPLKIHLTAIDYAEFKAMLNSKEFSVVSEAIRHNILLFGMEDYYRILNST